MPCTARATPDGTALGLVVTRLCFRNWLKVLYGQSVPPGRSAMPCTACAAPRGTAPPSSNERSCHRARLARRRQQTTRILWQRLRTGAQAPSTAASSSCSNFVFHSLDSRQQEIHSGVSVLTHGNPPPLFFLPAVLAQLMC